MQLIQNHRTLLLTYLFLTLFPLNSLPRSMKPSPTCKMHQTAPPMTKMAFLSHLIHLHHHHPMREHLFPLEQLNYPVCTGELHSSGDGMKPSTEQSTKTEAPTDESSVNQMTSLLDQPLTARNLSTKDQIKEPQVRYFFPLLALTPSLTANPFVFR